MTRIENLPHSVPVGLLGLRVLEDIEASDSDAFCSQHVRDFHIHMPMQPCPELVAMSDGSLRKLFITIHVSTMSSQRVEIYFRDTKLTHLP